MDRRKFLALGLGAAGTGLAGKTVAEGWEDGTDFTELPTHEQWGNAGWVYAAAAGMGALAEQGRANELERLLDEYEKGELLSDGEYLLDELTCEEDED